VGGGGLTWEEVAVGKSVKVGRREQRASDRNAGTGDGGIKRTGLSRLVYDWRREMSLCGRRQCGGDTGRAETATWTETERVAVWNR
jgi:hypothetical protein